ncbi:MAG: CDP-alcohol phosphatidyltransferase family protein [Xanthomonadaceae bacterium]|nr:CDP-alcohol phosphatidyltransferase family protein [Xanthomonadaceae bacterium]
MASIYELKPAFQSLLRPLVKRMAGAGVRANAVTVVAAGLSALVGLALFVWPGAAGPLLVLPAFLVARMALNAIDGMLAREHDQQTRLGAFLNELGDVVSDAALYLPLALVASLNPVLIVLIVVLGIIAEMTGVISQMLAGERRYDGPMGKSDRALVFGALALWAGLGGALDPWADWLLALVLALSLLTILNRARGGLAGDRRA